MSFQSSKELALGRVPEHSAEDLVRLLGSLTDFVFQMEWLPSGEIRKLYSSPNPQTIFGRGFDLEASLSDAFRSITHPDDVELYEDFCERIRQSDQCEVEYRIIDTQGATRWVWIRVAKRMIDGRMFVDGICSDITSRLELTEERAKAHQFRLDLVTALSNKMGTALSSVIKLCEHALREPDLSADARHYIVTVIESSERIDRIRRDIVTMCSTATSLTTNQRVADLRARTEAQALASSYESAGSDADFARLLTTLDDFVFSMQFQPPDHNGTVLYSSPTFVAQKLFGSRFEFGPDWGDVMRTMIHPDDRALYEAYSQELLEGKMVNGEYRVIGTDGVVRWVWTRVSVRQIDGYFYLDGICSDVSVRHQLIEERAHAEQFRIEMISMLSDKIGNALAGSVGFTELALADTLLTSGTRSLLENVTDTNTSIDEIRSALLLACESAHTILA